MTPEEKLCSRWWRMRNSAWVLVSILSLGTLTWAGFLYIGIRAKRRSWLITAGAFALFFISYGVLTQFVDMGTKENPVSTPLTSLIGGALVAEWVAGVVLSVVANRKWLVWLAHRASGPWYVAPGTDSSRPASAQTPVDAQVEAALRSATLTAPSAQPIAGTTVDINTATASELATTGIDLEWAAHIVQARTQDGAFASVDELMTRAEMPPHYFLRFKDKLSVSTARSVAPSATRGRRLDI